MLDQRYPYMHPVQHSVPSDEWKRVGDVLLRIRERSGCSACMDRRDGTLVFYAGSLSRTRWRQHYKRPDGTFAPVSADEVCNILNLANVPDQVKDFWTEQHRQFHKSQERDAERKRRNDLRPAALERAERTIQASRGLSRTLAVVDGAKP